MPSSSEDETEEDEGERTSQESSWELSMEGWAPPNLGEDNAYAMLPQIKQAIDIMMGGRSNPTNLEGVEDESTSPMPPSQLAAAPDLGEAVTELGMGVDAIPSNSVTTGDVVGMDEMVEATSLDNRNFIRVIIGGEAHLALLDPGETVSLVGPKILNKYRDRLQETSGQVRGVSGTPMKIQGILRILIEADGHQGSIDFRAVEEIKHEIILGMDFGAEWNLTVQLRAKQWRCGVKGDRHPFATNNEDTTPAIMAECAELTEITPSEAERVKEIVDRLIRKPKTDYLPTTHLTEHHIELTDYTPIRLHPRRRSPAMWAVG